MFENNIYDGVDCPMQAPPEQKLMRLISGPSATTPALTNLLSNHFHPTSVSGELECDLLAPTCFHKLI